MTKRIFRSIALVALAVFLAALVLIMGVLYTYFSGVQSDQLKALTDLAAHGVEHEGEAYLTGLSLGDCRITWIAADGTVLFDNQSAAHEMENHLARQEVQEALQSGYGEETRYSNTMLMRMTYTAQRLQDGSVIRLSNTQYSVLTLIVGMLQPIAMVILFAAGLSLWLAYSLSQRIVEPLNSLDLNDPMNNKGYDEIAPLLRRIDSQQRQIRSQSAELQRRRDEFNTVTRNMTEGLILLGQQRQILSINEAAMSILDANPACVGRPLCEICRNPVLLDVLEKGCAGIAVEAVIALHTREYQLDASPVKTDGVPAGVALLIFDVTERARAEQLRREFTANVSHELKTPLHTISGCAELLCNDMVRPEDTHHFSQQIYTEAQRMIRLVEDIIRLSRLDEGMDDTETETIDLYALAAETLENLQQKAREADVTLHLEGSPAPFETVRQLVSQILYNLCGNAIKYNRPGGTVTVTVTPLPQEIRLTVADTGIGIPQEHQSRIFERFYRVDKSHSKEMGGTGLGLSIVKHAARLLNARLSLESTPDVGTVFTVIFPCDQSII